jgi:hypothetical protein
MRRNAPGFLKKRKRKKKKETPIGNPEKESDVIFGKKLGRVPSFSDKKRQIIVACPSFSFFYYFVLLSSDYYYYYYYYYCFVKIIRNLRI